MKNERADMERCLICGKEISPDGGSPYSVCYDPAWEYNVWGGDSHEYIGYLCWDCGEKLKTKAKADSDGVVGK